MPVSRRRFVQSASIAGVGLLAGCERLPGQAAPAPRIPRIGHVGGNPDSVTREAFQEGLREHGYVEGESIVVEWRDYALPDELPRIIAEFVGLAVDMIVAPTTAAALAAKQATSRIPIVIVTAGDPVGDGLVESLARPGGNVTGVSSLFSLLGQKRLELLKQAAPQTARVACLYHAADPSSTATMRHILEAADPLGVSVEAVGVRGPEDFELAFDAATRLPADALLTTQGVFLLRNRERIVDFAAQHRLPAIYPWREAVESGGLMAYGPSLAAQFRRAAYYVDRIIKGAKPADLPVEQPTTFEFAINLKTAQALSLTIPQHVLLQATEVLQ
jgi:putative tryptophan/tyrosine transport system substrate-binding protein